MAQPIAFHAPANPVPLNLDRLQQAPAEHAEALLSMYELVQLLHDRGVLNLLRGMVSAGDDLIGAASEAAQRPESIRAIRNILLMGQLLASISPEVLTGVVQTVNELREQGAPEKPPGLLRLLWRARSEDNRRALSFGIGFLEALGRRLQGVSK